MFSLTTWSSNPVKRWLILRKQLVLRNLGRRARMSRKFLRTRSNCMLHIQLCEV